MQEPYIHPLQAIVPPLIEWYRKNRIEWPFRKDPTPYHVWLSEIMLQQTRIEAALPYYERFLTQLPTVEALAAVEDDKLMKLWQGLGYYSRARNLKKAAIQICEQYGGVLPKDVTLLKKLPGIGDYTAGAISSIAYGCPEPAVDGNVLRVIMHLTACSDDIMLPAVRTRVADTLRSFYPSGKDASLFTEGLMELGEVVCIPNGEARCSLCPIRGHCEAFRRGETDRYPVRSSKKERRIVKKTILLLKNSDRYAIVRRPAKGLLAGLWEFPSVDGHLTADDVGAWCKEKGLAPLNAIPCGKAKHIFSHVEWHMIGYQIDCASESADYVWADTEIIRSEYALPTAFRFYVALLD